MISHFWQGSQWCDGLQYDPGHHTCNAGTAMIYVGSHLHGATWGAVGALNGYNHGNHYFFHSKSPPYSTANLHPQVHIWLGIYLYTYILSGYLTVRHGKWPIYRWFTYYKWAIFHGELLNNQRVYIYTVSVYIYTYFGLMPFLCRTRHQHHQQPTCLPVFGGASIWLAVSLLIFNHRHRINDAAIFRAVCSTTNQWLFDMIWYDLMFILEPSKQSNTLGLFILGWYINKLSSWSR